MWGAGRLFAIDSRSLIAFRVALGTVLIADVAYRAVDLGAHYSDDGVLPRVLYQEVFGGTPGAWSLHLLGGSAAFQGLLFALLALVALALVAGIRPRASAVIAWVLLVSLQNRQPLVATGADVLLRMLLFWAVLLPLPGRGLRSSTPAAEVGASVLSVASAALLIQVGLVYVFSTIFKLQDSSWTGLIAIETSLRVEGVVTDLGRQLLAWPDLLAVLTGATLAVEFLAPILAFCPWKTGPIRAVLAPGMIAFHCLGIGAVMNLGLFEYVAATAWIPFLPAALWNRVAGPIRGTGSGPAAEPGVIRGGRAIDAIALLALVLVVAANVDSLSSSGARGRGWAVVRLPARMLALSQRWNLWSTPMVNRYYVFPACLEDGSMMDLHTGEPLDWNRPRRESQNNHWWKYQHLVSSHPIGMRVISGYASHLVSDWEATHPEQRVAWLRLFRVDGIPPDGQPAKLPRRLLFELRYSESDRCLPVPAVEPTHSGSADGQRHPFSAELRVAADALDT
jgi:hypothetical protein